MTAQVLRDLPKSTDPNLLVGADHFDDAGVYRLSAESALVTTLDFFPPLVDDPYVFGQIAATNSLSDIYAMGGRPICALNIVGFPDKDLPAEILSEILSGGAERVAAAGACIAGGHSVRDAEIKYGLSVTGLVHPDRILTNGGAKPGDVIVLTKPIGTGTLTTAAKQDKIGPDDLAESIDSMADLNAGACKAVLDVGAHAVTDVTGFGLLGHAREMAEAGGVTIEILSERVPLLANALDLARQGVMTRVYRANLDFIGAGLKSDGVDETLLNLIADAQTSGGLLIAVSQENADDLVEALKRNKTKASAIIGNVLPRSDHSLIVR